jgi:hypothetical protein
VGSLLVTVFQLVMLLVGFSILYSRVSIEHFVLYIKNNVKCARAVCHFAYEQSSTRARAARRGRGAARAAPLGPRPRRPAARLRTRSLRSMYDWYVYDAVRGDAVLSRASSVSGGGTARAATSGSMSNQELVLQTRTEHK